MMEAWSLAEKHGITFYDASYVALCESVKIPFYTADAKLLGKLKNKIPLVKSLSSYPG